MALGWFRYSANFLHSAQTCIPYSMDDLIVRTMTVDKYSLLLAEAMGIEKKGRISIGELHHWRKAFIQDKRC